MLKEIAINRCHKILEENGKHSTPNLTRIINSVVQNLEDLDNILKNGNSDPDKQDACKVGFRELLLEVNANKAQAYDLASELGMSCATKHYMLYSITYPVVEEYLLTAETVQVKPEEVQLKEVAINRCQKILEENGKHSTPNLTRIINSVVQNLEDLDNILKNGHSDPYKQDACKVGFRELLLELNANKAQAYALAGELSMHCATPSYMLYTITYPVVEEYLSTAQNVQVKPEEVQRLAEDYVTPPELGGKIIDSVVTESAHPDL